MSGARLGRRAVLQAAAAVGIGTTQLGTARASDGPNNACTRQDNGTPTQTINPPADSPPNGGEDSTLTSLEVEIPPLNQSLAVTAVDSKTTGPTALIVGGIHGDEVAGYRAATQLLDWSPTAGQLAILPKANPVAISRGSRSTEYGNLNRHFPTRRAPSSPVARAVWNVIERVDPDILLTLHESRGIYKKDSSGVGQTVFHSPTEVAHDAARMGIRRANRTIGSQRLKLKTGHISHPSIAPTGLLAEKTAYDVGIPSFIIETYEGVNLNARIRWQKAVVRGVLDYFDLTD